MGDGVDDFVQKLQQQIYEEAKEAYGEPAFQRWQNPLYMGTMPDADGHACVHGKCGDTMEIFLRFNGDRVDEALFQTDGCGSSIACASFAAEMARGKTPDQLLEVSGESILNELGGLPEDQQHCAFLAAETLQTALDDYMLKQTKKSESVRTSVTNGQEKDSR